MPNNITHWNRLEGSAYKEEDATSLEFRVRDPLWMLSRQWQMGEFEAEDNGSPIEVICKYSASKVKGLKNRGNKKYKSFDFGELPLEAEVENINSHDYSLQDAYQAGKILMDVIDTSTLSKVNKLKLKKGILKKENSFLIDGKSFIPDKKLNGYFKLLLRKPQLNGIKLYQKTNSLSTFAGQSVNTKGIEQEWRARLEKSLPFLIKKDTFWKSDQLEYQFDVAVSEGNENFSVYNADEYYNGTIDWYNFKGNKKKQKKLVTSGNLAPERVQRSMIPVELTFPGMPTSKLWEIENRKHNLLNLHPEKSELLKLIINDFAMNYSNDWFDFPLTVENGNKVTISSIHVKDVFGKETEINQVKSKVKFFDNNDGDNSLLLLTTNTKKEQGPTIEKIVFVRDEIANLVFAIEEIVPNGLGNGIDFEKAKTSRQKYPVKIENDKVPNQYKIKSQFEENWIPFMPKKKSNAGDMILQRGSQLRYDEGTKSYKRVRPSTILLREGIDNNGSQKEAFFINEEEVPKSGIIVTTNFQRTRWYNGKVVTWLGREKTNGKGVGGSNLRFDYLE